MSNEQSLDFLQNLSSTENSLQQQKTTQNQSTYSVSSAQASQQPDYQQSQQPVYQQNTQTRVLQPQSHHQQQQQQQTYQKTSSQQFNNSSAPALDQQIIPPLQSGNQSQPVGVFTLLASHFSLIGERLKDISTNIETHLKNGDVPNIDRSLDTLLDTILYVSNVLILLFKSIPELEHPESPETVHRELINLAVFHLSAAQIQKVPKVPVKLQEQIVARPQHQQQQQQQAQQQQHHQQSQQEPLNHQQQPHYSLKN
jgi:hypothetical protein